MFHNIVLYCLIIANVLNLFSARYSYGGTGERRLIIWSYGAAIIVTIVYMLVHYVKLPKCYIWLKFFVTLFILYFIIQYFFVHSRYFILSNYVRWYMSLLFLFFFYSFEETKKSKRLMEIFIFTFIIECAYKVFFGKAFASVGLVAKRVGGDTASMGLALVTPLLLAYFRNKKGLVLYVVCFVFCLFSLRRTSILAVAAALPFIWPTLKRYVKKKYLVMGAIISLFVFSRAWEYVGAKVINRFLESNRDDTFSTGYGSGRTAFWRFLYRKYIENANWYFGNGMGSIHETFSRNWYLPLSHAHNDILEVGYTFGFVGLFVWCSYWYNMVRYAWKNADKENKKLFVCSMAVFLIAGLTSGTILRAETFPMAMVFPILLKRIYDTKLANEPSQAEMLIKENQEKDNVLVHKW